MAKPLSAAVPSSSVARLLEAGAASAATSTPPRLIPARAAPRPEVAAEPAASAPIKREFVLTPAADEALRQAVIVYQRAVGGSVTNSHFLRAVLQVVAHAMPEIERQAGELGPMKRPSNARADEARREQFERRLADTLCRAFRAAPFME
jgi:hypothetical protein